MRDVLKVVPRHTIVEQVFIDLHVSAILREVSMRCTTEWTISQTYLVQQMTLSKY